MNSSKWLLKCLSLAALLITLPGCMTSMEPSVYNARPLAGPGPGRALVVLYRESQFGGSVIPFGISEDGRSLGRLGNGHYVRVETTPGRHSFTASSEAKETKSFPVEAGRTYYLRVGVHEGLFIARPHLTLTDPQEGASAVARMHQDAPRQ